MRSVTSCCSAPTACGPTSSRWWSTMPSRASPTSCAARTWPTTRRARSTCSAASDCPPRAICTRRWYWGQTARSCPSRTAPRRSRWPIRSPRCARPAPCAGCQPIARRPWANGWPRPLRLGASAIRLRPDRAGRASQAQQVLAVVHELVDRLVDVGQRGVLLRLLEAFQRGRLPAPRQLLERADVEVAIVEEGFQLGH